jgi:hypothetical protein
VAGYALTKFVMSMSLSWPRYEREEITFAGSSLVEQATARSVATAAPRMGAEAVVGRGDRVSKRGLVWCRIMVRGLLGRGPVKPRGFFARIDRFPRTATEAWSWRGPNGSRKKRE